MYGGFLFFVAAAIASLFLIYSLIEFSYEPQYFFIAVLVLYILSCVRQLGGRYEALQKEHKQLQSVVSTLSKSVGTTADTPLVEQAITAREVATSTDVNLTVGADVSQDAPQDQLPTSTEAAVPSTLEDRYIPAEGVLPPSAAAQAQQSPTPEKRFGPKGLAPPRRDTSRGRPSTLQSETPVLASNRSEPSVIAKFFQQADKSGSTWVIGGVVLLFIGLIFLVHYVQNAFPPELRLACVGLFGIVLAGVGYKQYKKRPILATILQGGGIGVLYLTLVAALRMYDFMGSSITLALLFAVTGLAVFLALAQNSQSLAVVSSIAGMLAPIMVSDGSNNYVGLFSIHSIFNIGMAVLVLKRNWRILHYTSIVLTFGIFTIWAAGSFKPEFFLKAEPFLIFFALLHMLVLLSSLRREARLGNLEGWTVPLVPALILIAQYQICREQPFVFAGMSLFLGFVLLAYSRSLWREAGEAFRPLVELVFLTGVASANLALPFTLLDMGVAHRGNMLWVMGVYWAILAPGLYSLGISQGSKHVKLVSLIFLVAAILCTSLGYLDISRGAYPLINLGILGYVFVLFGVIYFGKLLEKDSALSAIACKQRSLFLFGGMAFIWYLVLAFDLDRGQYKSIYAEYMNEAIFLIFALSAAFFAFVSKRLSLKSLYLFVPMGLIVFIPTLLNSFFTLYYLTLLHSTNFNLLAQTKYHWISLVSCVLFLALQWTLLYRHRNRVSENLQRIWVLALALFPLPFISMRMSIYVDSFQLAYIWVYMAAWFPLLTSLLIITSSRVIARVPALGLPVQKDGTLQTHALAGLLMAIPVVFFLLIACFMRGNPSPLMWLPLLNPLEICHWAGLAGLVSLLWCLTKNKWRSVSRKHVYFVIAVGSFFILNTSFMRIAHFWGDVPFRLSAMLANAPLQATLTSVWGICGLLNMYLGSVKLRDRWIWSAGAVLVGLDVAKLFLVDLAAVNTLGRIISFLAVGVLLIIIGFFTPIPPRTGTKNLEKRTT